MAMESKKRRGHEEMKERSGTRGRREDKGNLFVYETCFQGESLSTLKHSRGCVPGRERNKVIVALPSTNY